MAPVRGGRFAQDVIRRDDSLLIRERRCGRTAYEREMFLTCRVSGLMPAKSASVDGVPYLVYRTEGWRALTDSMRYRMTARWCTVQRVPCVYITTTPESMKKKWP